MIRLFLDHFENNMNLIIGSFLTGLSFFLLHTAGHVQSDKPVQHVLAIAMGMPISWLVIAQISATVALLCMVFTGRIAIALPGNLMPRLTDRGAVFAFMLWIVLTTTFVVSTLNVNG